MLWWLMILIRNRQKSTVIITTQLSYLFARCIKYQYMLKIKASFHPKAWLLLFYLCLIWQKQFTSFGYQLGFSIRWVSFDARCLLGCDHCVWLLLFIFRLSISWGLSSLYSFLSFWFVVYYFNLHAGLLLILLHYYYKQLNTTELSTNQKILDVNQTNRNIQSKKRRVGKCWESFTK